jgi:putative serine protease PepD
VSERKQPVVTEREGGGAPVWSRSASLLVAAALIAALVGAAVGVGVTLAIVQGSVKGPEVNLPGSKVTVTDGTAVAQVAQKSQPAVVTILTQSGSGSGSAAGSGFLVSGDGYIVTSVAVAAGSTQLKVLIGGSSRLYDARLVDYDCPVGLAVLKVDGVSNLPTLSFGDSSAMQPGQDVILLAGAQPGRALVTSGVVSAVGRPVSMADPVSKNGNVTYWGAIETDATIDPSFVGGPLLNVNDQVVGVVGRGTELGGSLAYGMPSDSIQTDVQQLTGGAPQISVADLGVSTEEVTSDQVALNGGGAVGAKITSLTGAGPASQAGLQVGDVITRLDDQQLSATEPLPELLRAHFKPDQRVTVTYTRAGNSAQVQLVLDGEHPAC